MTSQELFKSLEEKHVDSFHTSVLGFTLGSLIDRGVSEDEVRALCALLLEKILQVKKNPEAVPALQKFLDLAGKVM